MADSRSSLQPYLGTSRCLAWLSRKDLAFKALENALIVSLAILTILARRYANVAFEYMREMTWVVVSDIESNADDA